MKRIFIAGHNGMVGSAIIRQLKQRPDVELVLASRDELDLVDQKQVKDFFAQQEFDQVYLAAAKVGGIHANNEYPAEFIYQNLMMEANIIHAAHQNNVQNLLFLGSSCIYPKAVDQPMKEDALLTGTLESTNEPYAIAKIAGIKMCESYNRQYSKSHSINYRSVMPSLMPSLIKNLHSYAHEVSIKIKFFLKFS
jgi:GDP-L-fucose synthase